MNETRRSPLPAFAVIHLAFAALIQAQQQPPRREVNDPGVVATGQRVTPAGVQSVFTGRVAGGGFPPRRGAGSGGPPRPTRPRQWSAARGTARRSASWNAGRVLAP